MKSRVVRVMQGPPMSLDGEKIRRELSPWVRRRVIVAIDRGRSCSASTDRALE